MDDQTANNNVTIIPIIVKLLNFCNQNPIVRYSYIQSQFQNMSGRIVELVLSSILCVLNLIGLGLIVGPYKMDIPIKLVVL